jgi:hypothetical protein
VDLVEAHIPDSGVEHPHPHAAAIGIGISFTGAALVVLGLTHVSALSAAVFAVGMATMLVMVSRHQPETARRPPPRHLHNGRAPLERREPEAQRRAEPAATPARDPRHADEPVPPPEVWAAAASVVDDVEHALAALRDEAEATASVLHRVAERRSTRRAQRTRGMDQQVEADERQVVAAIGPSELVDAFIDGDA